MQNHIHVKTVTLTHKTKLKHHQYVESEEVNEEKMPWSKYY